MSHLTRLIARITPVALAVLVLVLGIGCGDGTPAAQQILSPTPTPTAASPAPPETRGSLAGMVYEMTPAGRTPVDGVSVYHLTCFSVNCPSVTTLSRQVRTDRDGAFRISDVYNGALNYVWVAKEGYRAADPIPPLGSCDGCDRIVDIGGDTRLDIEVVRR
jgi:hypothetical protein